jgi:hypothetical protein
MTNNTKELYKIFSNELDLYISDKKKYNVVNFLEETFFPNISDFVEELPNFYQKVIKKNDISILDVYDFCYLILDDIYIKILKDSDEKINKLSTETESDKQIKKEELEILETYCIYGLSLFNFLFLVNQSILINSELFFDSNGSKKENKKDSKKEFNLSSIFKRITNKILNRSFTSVCLDKQNEILTSISEICVLLKNNTTKPISFFNSLLFEKLSIDENFSLTFKDN